MAEQSGNGQPSEDNEVVSMDGLIARLSEQQALLDKQKSALVSTDQPITSRGDQSDSTTGSTLMTPATDAFSISPATETSEEDKTIQQPTGELDRLKQELEDAKNRLAYQEKELTQTRAMHSTFDHLKPGSGAAIQKAETNDLAIANIHEALQGNRATGLCQPPDDARSDVSEFSHAGSVVRGQNPWMNVNSTGVNAASVNPLNVWNQGNGRHWLNRPMAPNLPPLMVPQLQPAPMRAYSGASSPTSSSGGRFMNEFGSMANSQGNRRFTNNGRTGQSLFSNRSQGWDGGFGGNGEVSPIMGMNPQYQPMGMFQAPVGYQPRPIGTPLSPTAAEFNGVNPPGPWNSTVSAKCYSCSRSCFRLADSFVAFVTRPDVRLSYGAAQLSPSARSQRYVQLEVYCRQDRLQQRPASLHLPPTETQSWHGRAEVRDR